MGEPDPIPQIMHTHTRAENSVSTWQDISAVLKKSRAFHFPRAQKGSGSSNKEVTATRRLFYVLSPDQLFFSAAERADPQTQARLLTCTAHRAAQRCPPPAQRSGDRTALPAPTAPPRGREPHCSQSGEGTGSPPGHSPVAAPLPLAEEIYTYSA